MIYEEKNSALLTLVLIITMLFPYTALAHDDTEMRLEYAENQDKEIIYVTEKEFEYLLSGNSVGNIYARVATCCNSYPRLAWKYLSTMHIYNPSTGVCLSLAYYGN